VVQAAHEVEVLAAGEQAVDGRELAGDADALADRVGVADHVVAVDERVAAAGGDQGRQDVHRGGLAGAVGAEEGEDGALRNGDVDTAEDRLVAVGLGEVPGFDRHGLGGGHDSFFRGSSGAGFNSGSVFLAGHVSTLAGAADTALTPP
jgi:hypothetical protein